MIRNFFTVAFRNFFRQRFFSFINILGLTSGLTCFLLIYLWVRDEIGKDKFHANEDRIFHIVSNLQLADGQILTWTITPGPLAEDIRENIPEVEAAARTMSQGPMLLQYMDKNFMERGYYADPEFFKVFSFKILHGRSPERRDDISSISISNQLARKLFGNDDPIGKTIKVNQGSDFTVAAVFEDVSSASSLRFDYILPFEIYKKNRGSDSTGAIMIIRYT